MQSHNLKDTEVIGEVSVEKLSYWNLSPSGKGVETLHAGLAKKPTDVGMSLTALWGSDGRHMSMISAEKAVMEVKIHFDVHRGEECYYKQMLVKEHLRTHTDFRIKECLSRGDKER